MAAYERANRELLKNLETAALSTAEDVLDGARLLKSGTAPADD